MCAVLGNEGETEGEVTGDKKEGRISKVMKQALLR